MVLVHRFFPRREQTVDFGSGQAGFEQRQVDFLFLGEVQPDDGYSPYSTRRSARASFASSFLALTCSRRVTSSSVKRSISR